MSRRNKRAAAIVAYNSKREKTDLAYKFKQLLRARLRTALKGQWKSGSAVDSLGCSIPEFMAHIQSKFQPGMNWENHGTHGWHIDHIIPLSSFNLSNSDELKKACHYTNLQPLWAHDNLVKKDKINGN